MENGTYLVTFTSGKQLTLELEDISKRDGQDVAIFALETFNLGDIAYFSNDGGTWKVGVPAKEENIVELNRDDCVALLRKSLDTCPIMGASKVLDNNSGDQINTLANFIMDEVEGEPSQSQGAVDTAIRIMTQYMEEEEKWVKKVADLNEEIAMTTLDNKMLREELEKSHKRDEESLQRVSDLEAEVVELTQETTKEVNTDGRVPRGPKKK